MGIGVGIFLIALGAILTFAVDWTVGGLDLKAVGWVLMAAGVAGLILFFYFWNRRRVPVAVAQHSLREAPRTYDDATPPPPS
jgi:membrane protease YdiL (CAAX protease family)